MSDELTQDQIEERYTGAKLEWALDQLDAGHKVVHYRGRFWYEGPAVSTHRQFGPSIQDVIRASKIKSQWDSLGLDHIVYVAE